MTDHVAISREDGIIVLRLDRPEKKNALTGAMYAALMEAFAQADRDRLAAVVLTGSGGSFTAGNDIADFLAYARQPGAAPPFRFLEALVALETPLVAAVEGVAVGIGTTILLHCDLAYAGPSARFQMPFVDLGLVPEAGSTRLLPERVGGVKAAELLLLAEAFDAEEALRLGLVNAVVPAAALMDHALAQARRLAAKPRGALRTTRALLRRDRDALLAVIRAESEAFGAALASPEARAAFEAFLGKARPAAESIMV